MLCSGYTILQKVTIFALVSANIMAGAWTGSLFSCNYSYRYSN